MARLTTTRPKSTIILLKKIETIKPKLCYTSFYLFSKNDYDVY